MELSDEDRVALNYCAPHGIPLSIFQGRVHGLGEPYWLSDDFHKAILWQIEQSQRCSGCGRSRSECMDPDGPDYEVEMLRCFACEARDAKMAAVSREAQQTGSPNHGAYFVVREVEEPQDGDVAVAG